MRVAFFPNSPRWDVNPSLLLLRRALAAEGVTLVTPPRDTLSARWLWKERAKIDVLHFHWIQYHYRSSSRFRSLLALLGFALRLCVARWLGYGVVWTLHNILPHERAKGRVDEWARWLMMRLAHQVLVYCTAGQRAIQEHFGRTQGVFNTSRGAYNELGWGVIDQKAARDSLGLSPDAFVFLYFGYIRGYKQTPHLVRSFQRLSGDHLRLVLVGQIQDAAIGRELARLTPLDSRIECAFGYADDEELRLFLAAADVVVLPFGEILSSGSALMALSCGRPVIAPALGCLPEWITPACGLLYDPSDRDALRQALIAIQQADIRTMQQAALAQAGRFTWEYTARQTVLAYARAGGNREA